MSTRNQKHWIVKTTNSIWENSTERQIPKNFSYKDALCNGNPRSKQIKDALVSNCSSKEICNIGFQVPIVKYDNKSEIPRVDFPKEICLYWN